MIYKDKVNFLRSYKDKYYRLEWLDNHMSGIKAIMYEERIPGPKKTLNDYLQEKMEIEKDMQLIEKIIKEVQDNKQRYVLEYKFLRFKTLEEISEIMNYSLRQTQRIYRDAINNTKHVV